MMRTIRSALQIPEIAGFAVGFATGCSTTGGAFLIARMFT